MTPRAEALDTCRDEILALLPRYRASSIRLTGSVARGDDGPDSDFDFIVDFLPGASLMDIAGLQLDIEELLGQSVDIVPSDSRSHCWPELLADAVAL